MQGGGAAGRHPWDEAARLAALDARDPARAGDEAVFADAVRIAAQACGAPLALVNFVGATRLWSRAAWGCPPVEASRAEQFCDAALREGDLFVVPDLGADTRFAAHPFVAGEAGLRFYAGAVIETADGLPLGTVCVLDDAPRPDGITPDQAATLRTLARMVMRELDLARSNRALRETEERHSALIAASGAVVWRTDAVGTSLASAVSDAFAGGSDDHLGQGWLAFLHPDDRARAVENWSRARRTGEPFEIVERKLAADGTYRWVQTRAVPLNDPGGAVREWVGTCTDIHERHEAQLRLRESEERYRALVDASAVIVWRAAPDGSIMEAQGWEEFCGQDAGAYLGRGWLDAIHPDDRPRVVASWQAHAGTPRPGSFDYRVRCRDGYRWVSVRCVPLVDETGRVREWVGTVTDIHERREAELRLKEGEERYRALVEATAAMVWRTDAAGTVQDVFSAGSFPAFDPAEDGWAVLVHPDDLARSRAAWDAARTSGTPLDIVERKRTHDGGYRYVHVRGQPVRRPDGAIREWIGAVTDIDEGERLKRELAANEERLRRLLEAMPAAVYTTDPDGRITYFNEAAAALWGAKPALGEARWCGAWRLSWPDGTRLPHDECPMAIALRQRRPLRGMEAVAERPDGTRVPFIPYPTPLLDADGALLGGVNVLVDITDRRRREDEVWHTAHHDALTGLPNRILFARRLEAALAEAGRAGAQVGLLLVDLDGFKDVNDTLGHHAGDALLRETAARLKGLTRAGDMVARLGGDEFALILAEPGSLAEAADFAEAVAERLRAPLVVEGRTLSPKASIGLAAFPDHHRLPDDLMKAADIALYQAKGEGRNRVAVYTPAAREMRERRAGVLREVRAALDESRFLPFYQPKVCLRTGRVVGFEALARWQDPERGLLTPGYFAPAFEDPELAIRIGKTLVRRVAEDIRAWLDAGLDCGRVAVNVSSAEFADPRLAEEVLAVLEAARVPTHHFEVEVTETVFLGRSAQAVSSILDRFHAGGVSIALDDFGTGYASLTHLKQFPVDHIKIDRSFVRDLEVDRDDAAIVEAVIGLGRSLGVTVTAEGVETEGQAARLAALGCDQAQGFLYARPTIASRVPWLLTTSRDEGRDEPLRAAV